MILVSLEGCVERACRTALREQPLLSSFTGWMCATSGLVEDLNIPVRKTGNAQKHLSVDLLVQLVLSSQN